MNPPGGAAGSHVTGDISLLPQEKGIKSSGLGMISLEGRRASYRASIVVQDSIA